MVKVVGIRFRNAGKIYYFGPGKLQLKAGMHAIVETARGVEMGTVMTDPREVSEESVVQPLKPVIRIATEQDEKQAEKNRQKEKEAFKICLEKIAKHKLDMKLVEAEYTFDNNKLLFYFTADGRIDFRELVKEHRHSFIRACRMNDSLGSIIDFSWGLGVAAMYFVGIRILGTDQVSLGTFIAFGTYIGMFWSPIMNLSNFYNQIISNLAAAERIFEVLDTKPEITDENDSVMPPMKGDVVFQNVCFSYDNKVNVLQNVSFHIHPGETIALVGPTGAGKTTIVNLISRFYDVQKGAVLIDGIDVRSVTTLSLRSQMGIMTQDNFLFTGTIRDNIRYGRLDATDDEIIAAAKAVHAHEFIMKLDKGYDTELKERGGGLSVGQKQLLAFARTMISDPSILILDEATSSIDTNTELLVQEGIETLLQGRTSFVIAHRLSTIQKADRIFVIDQGGILEEGNAHELLEKKGAYYRLHMAQMALPVS